MSARRRARSGDARSRAAPTVRLARASDIPDLVALEERCFGEADAFDRRVWRHLILAAAPRGTAITSVIEGVGIAASATALLRRGATVARIYTLSVDPACRGRGLAGHLVIDLARRARARRCDTLSLEVREGNDAALALYDRFGFTRVRDLPKYYADGADGMRLRAPIAVVLKRGR